MKTYKFFCLLIIFFLLLGIIGVQTQTVLALSILNVDNGNSACDDAIGTPYCTIQAAIDAANNGDIINVAAGIYTENVLVNRSVEIVGASQESTIVMPSVSNAKPCSDSSLCGGVASNVFLVEANDVSIHDLTVDGDNPALISGIIRDEADLDARNGIIKNLSGTFNNLEVYNTTVKNIYLRGIYSTAGTFNFHHNTVRNVQGDYSSIGIFAWYGPGTMASNIVSYTNDAVSANHSKGIQFLNNTITHSGSGVHTDNAGDSAGSVADLIEGNTVSDCTPGGYGVWVFVPYIAPTVNANTVTNCSVGLSAWGQANPVTTQFTNNTVNGPSGEADSVGVYLTTDWIYWGYSDLSVVFTGNLISGNETGIYITADQQSWNPKPYEAKTVDASFSNNHIEGNTIGLDKGTNGTYNVTAAYNWWGNASGPGPVGPGSGDTIADGVSYDPWLCNGTDTSSDPGFQSTGQTDCAAPISTNTSTNPNPAAVGGLVTLTANVDDTSTGGSVIASANYEIFDSSNAMVGSGSMSALNTFDDQVEDVTASIITPTTAGIYDLCVYGTDVAGNVGDPECIMFVVYDPSGGFVTGGGWIMSPTTAFLGIVRDGFAFDDRWVFNAEPPFMTPAGFTVDEASTGSGSLHVEPITNVVGNAAKFILRYGPDAEILLSDLDGFSIDFLIDDAGTKYAANQFYINLYALTPDPSDGGWYDCRFDYVATAGSTTTWTPLAFDGSTTATAVGDKIGGDCPSSFDAMPAGSTVLYLSVNLGDTSGNDTGVGGYFDNARMTVAGSTTSWDLGEGLAGRATFGFVSKYKKGASVPEGNTEFQFKAGGLNFHSTCYEWLVVNQGGTNAQFKGYGTINDSGNYGFMLWATDDSPDTFRIKIWDAATEDVVYDNGTDQTIGGGSIVVHKK